MIQIKQTSHEGTQSLIRAFHVFEVLCKAQKHLKIQEITKETGLNKSTIFRILATLRKLGYVDQDEKSEAYYVTMKVLTLSNSLLSGMEIRTIAQPIIQELVAQAHHAVHLSIRDMDQVVIIDKMETNAHIRVVSHIGRRSYMYSTGTGKVFLSLLSEPELTAYFDRTELQSLTPYTNTNKAQLREILKEIRAQGFAIDKQENALGISCIAAPIFDYSGKNIAALSITGPTAEIEGDLERLKNLVCPAVQKISNILGYTTHAK